MAFTLPVARPSVQLTLPDSTEHRRQLAQAINRNAQGHMNCTLFVTLDAGVAHTVVTDTRISPQTHFGLAPSTSDAAAAMATTYVVCNSGSATIYHANNSQTDRTFTATLIG